MMRNNFPAQYAEQRSNLTMASPSNSTVINGRFKVLRQLGEGAQGEVFKVNDLKDDSKMY
jgi:hypothetical protein